MHKRGMSHRDIKPDNILTTTPGADGLFDVKLTDFGFSCFFDPANSDDNLQIGT
jgi:serine/threonine protein kinase